MSNRLLLIFKMRKIIVKKIKTMPMKINPKMQKFKKMTKYLNNNPVKLRKNKLQIIKHKGKAIQKVIQ